MTPQRVAVVLGLSTACSAALGWAALVVVANLGGASAYASFAVMWGVYYGFGGALAGLQHEVMRVTAREDDAGHASRPRSVWTIALVTGAAYAIAGGLVAVGFQVFGSSLLLSALLTIGLVGFAGLVTALGMLAGQQRWATFAALLAADSAVRLLAVAAVMGAGWSEAAQMAAIAVGKLDMAARRPRAIGAARHRGRRHSEGIDGPLRETDARRYGGQRVRGTADCRLPLLGLDRRQGPIVGFARRDFGRAAATSLARAHAHLCLSPGGARADDS